jgi:hypothetical protein
LNVRGQHLLHLVTRVVRTHRYFHFTEPLIS